MMALEHLHHFKEYCKKAFGTPEEVAYNDYLIDNLNSVIDQVNANDNENMVDIQMMEKLEARVRTLEEHETGCDKTQAEINQQVADTLEEIQEGIASYKKEVAETFEEVRNSISEAEKTQTTVNENVQETLTAMQATINEILDRLDQ